jgi:UDP-N-acetylmuramate: L-alanyl-gamma-D-glutamyl-meso-diaminopimelate ligase
MHLHILGICGTFMGGIALLARQMGHTVTGSDANVYPPMSTQLEELGITVRPYTPDNLVPRPDVVVIGNALSRGNPEVEAVLNGALNYVSGPQWLAEHFLRGRHVLAVAGTHGKTTTSAMLAWILQSAQQEPGFLIGGIPRDFGVSARAGDGRYFVIEADEYDTAFFDKRAKFIHYHPQTLVLNNLEFDHADIYPDLAAIKQQFHYLVRTVPGKGQVIANGDDDNLHEVLDAGCWSRRSEFRIDAVTSCEWQLDNASDDYSAFDILHHGKTQARLQWQLIGAHNAANALAAIAAASDIGISAQAASEALAQFRSVKRRLEVRGSVNKITVYDDFAHHPTAIASTLHGLRRHCTGQRIIAVLEPRSNTMRLGVHRETLGESLQEADQVFLYLAEQQSWDSSSLQRELGDRLHVSSDMELLVSSVAHAARPGDQVLVMSNGSFGGIHEKILADLAQQQATGGRPAT